MVHYSDLLADWQRTLAQGLRAARPVPAARDAAARRAGGRRVHRSRSARSKGSWADVDAPRALKELGEQVWQEVVLIAQAGGERPQSSAALDALQEAYADLYYAAEATARSSILAGRGDRRRAGTGAGTGAGTS